MSSLVIIIIAATGLVGSFINKKSTTHLQLTVIIGLGLIWLSQAGFAAADPYTLLLSTLMGMVIAAFFAGMLLPRNTAMGLGLLLSAAPFFLLGNSYAYFGFEFEISGKIACLSLLGAVIPVIAGLKAHLLHKWVGADKQRTLGAISVLLVAFLVFFATFQAQYFGVILAGTGVLTMASILRSEELLGKAVGVLSLGFLFSIFKLHPSIDSAFMRGNFLMGVVLGAGALTWASVASGFYRAKWLLGVFIAVLVVFVGVLLGIPNENFGGIPTYGGAVLGASIALLATTNVFERIPTHALLLALIVPVTALFVKKEKTSVSRIAKTESAEVGKTEPDYLALPSIEVTKDQEGIWKSVREKSKLEFRLGPEGGVTTGAFTDFKVELDMDENGEPIALNLDMNAASITTFNEMRDESVLGEGFMEVDKFPKVKYTSKTFKKENDRYFVTGEFEMLGKKQPVNLEIKFAAKGMDKTKQYLVMRGKSKIDRTKFGMPGDAKIGNEVETTFEIEFQK